MALQELDVQIDGITRIAYVGRKKDENGVIVPYTSVSGAVIQEESIVLNDDSIEILTTKVRIPDGSEIAAYPIITLLKAPVLTYDFFVKTPDMSFQTGVFLHVEQLKSYTANEQSSNNSPDRTYFFRPTIDGLGITDNVKGIEHFFDRDLLVQLGVISNTVSWNYKERVHQWFKADAKFPSGAKPTNKFLTDIGKIPFTPSMLNNQAWDM